MSRPLLLATMIVAATCTTAAIWFDPAPRLVWNATASAPIGLYRVSPGGSVRTGGLVLAMPDPPLGRWLARRHYVPLGVPLIKPVAAKDGQIICRSGGGISIDGQRVAYARSRDRAGRPLPVWTGCRKLAADEVLLLNRGVADSLDGRYFGPLSTRAVIGTMHPLFTRDGPDTAFVWHGWRL